MHTYFLYDLEICFDYCDDVSAKLKYLNSCDYTFNPVLFIVNLEDSHFRSRENIPVLQQNSQTSKEIGADISLFFGSFVAYWHIVK